MKEMLVRDQRIPEERGEGSLCRRKVQKILGTWTRDAPPLTSAMRAQTAGNRSRRQQWRQETLHMIIQPTADHFEEEVLLNPVHDRPRLVGQCNVMYELGRSVRPEELEYRRVALDGVVLSAEQHDVTYAQVTPDDLGQQAKRCLNHTETAIVNPHSSLEKHDGAPDVNSSHGTLKRSHLRSTVDVDEDSGVWVRDSLYQSGELLRV